VSSPVLALLGSSLSLEGLTVRGFGVGG
jgi:hypothetical protein